MEDAPPNHLTTLERLEMLREHQKAWKTGSWTALSTINSRGHVWELNGGVVGLAAGASSLVFNQLPSKLRGIEAKKWTIDTPDIIIRDFVMDPGLDVLVAVELGE